MDDTKISPSLENYLETILFMQDKKEFVRITDIATELSISKPSVNKAIKVLKSEGLVLHEHYGFLGLTSKGYEIARSVAKRHVIIKEFLLTLGVDAQTAEREACLMEHSMSLDTVEKLSDFLRRLEPVQQPTHKTNERNESY